MKIPRALTGTAALIRSQSADISTCVQTVLEDDARNGLLSHWRDCR
jgi:hypothetical protein